MSHYAVIPKGKVGRFSQGDSDKYKGLAVSPVKGHTVIVLQGLRSEKESLTLIHYDQHTPTHTLNRERARFDDRDALKVYVYFNHLKSNPHLVEVVHVRLQESGIEHELREFPEKEKGILATVEETVTFNTDAESDVQLDYHPQQKNLGCEFPVNREMRLMEGLLKVGQLHSDGKITNAPGDSKLIIYEGDIYRHVNELADRLVEPLDHEEIIFDEGKFVDVGGDDTELSEFAKGIVDEIPAESRTKEDSLKSELTEVLVKRGSCQIPPKSCDVSHRINELVQVLMTSKLFA